MSVAEFAEHIGAYLKEVVARERIVYTHPITVVDLVPVESILLALIIEKAVMLIDNVP